MSSLLVQKFGGTSVGSPERIRAVAQHVAQSYFQGHDLVVVVSAMGHATDELVALAHQVSPTPNHREMDMLLTAGERISMALLSMALGDLKVPALSLTGSQSGIITDGSHRRARILRIQGDRIRRALKERSVVIVAGFQGVSEQKEITTLGRGGSDTTAVALAIALGAESCHIFTDVDGVYTADPRIVPQARCWEQIAYEGMLEMAECGAQVLHPRSVALAKKFQLPLVVRRSLSWGGGTRIQMQGMEDQGVLAVVIHEEQCFIQVDLMNWKGFLDLVLQRGLTMAHSLLLHEKVSFFLNREQESEWRVLLDALQQQAYLKSYRIDSNCIPLSIVGRVEDPQVLKKIMDLLDPVPFLSLSAQGMTLAIQQEQSHAVLQRLHHGLLESHG